MESKNICTVHNLDLFIISNISKIQNDLTVKNSDQNLTLKSFKIETKSTTIGFVTPQSRGSVDYSSTRGIQVDVGLPDATSENRAESPLYGELYPITVPA